MPPLLSILGGRLSLPGATATLSPGVALLCLVALATVCLSACEDVYPEQPEVIVVNEIAEHVLVKSVSFNGCKWDGVLAYEDSTSPKRCLPGEDRVHFQRFDAFSYCIGQVEDETIDGLCLCDPPEDEDDESSSTDPGLINTTPLWFNYQTITVHHAEDSNLHRFVLTADDLEQDFRRRRTVRPLTPCARPPSSSFSSSPVCGRRRLPSPKTTTERATTTIPATTTNPRPPSSFPRRKCAKSAPPPGTTPPTRSR